MKRFILAILITLFLILPSYASDGIIVEEVFNESLVASVAEYSIVLEPNKTNASGFWGVQIYLQDNDGSVTLEWEGSNNGVNYTEVLDPDGNRWDNICTVFAFNGGLYANGRECFTVQPPPFRFLRILITPSAHNIFNLQIIVSYTIDKDAQ